ncbi:hypothetical protein [Solimicrobium silvestre]|uniref:Uncharacterized protein n=1 Tax=Solimicrobium silvestre TaxID=2099400 RepID=A0A2S9GU33_9BURK|nr:hypothetical protein [Solimicrobium silvestre]PRC91211.1 hypothetical protein S2091_4106 [Solimicrobium silvestre]
MRTTDNSGAKMYAVEIEQIHTDISKMMAETAKLNSEASWYPIIVAVGIMGGTAAVLAGIAAFVNAFSE